MIKTIMVPVGGSDSDHVVFETARIAAQPFAAHLEFFHVRVGLGEAALHTPHANFARGHALRNTLTHLAEESSVRSIAACRHVGEFCEKWGIPVVESAGALNTVTASFCEEAGDAQQRLISRARLNDLVIMGRFTRPNGLPADLLDALLRGCGRSILLASPHAPRSLTGTVMVCWKDAPEPARALTAALPMLVQANRVVIATVDEREGLPSGSAEDLARHLAWHGIHAEAQSIPAEGRPAASVLRDAAQRCGADLLVMGCFGHGRARTLMFGSCTSALLRDAELPVFLLH